MILEFRPPEESYTRNRRVKIFQVSTLKVLPSFVSIEQQVLPSCKGHAISTTRTHKLKRSLSRVVPDR